MFSYTKGLFGITLGLKLTVAYKIKVKKVNSLVYFSWLLKYI